MIKLLVGPGLLLGLAVSASAAAQPNPRAADEAAIRQADRDWVKAAQTKQVAAWMGFYTADAVMMPPSDRAATTWGAIEKSVGQLLAAPDLSIGWQPVQVDVARSGELAYSIGTYEIGFRDPKGEQVREIGKYLEIWKKQANGTWKCAIDMWNTEPPM